MTVARRISVVGPTGSGKSAVAIEIATRSRLPCTHLDDLRYHDDWTPAPDDELRATVADIVATDGWIIEGNYAAVRDLMWDSAELVVWLDLPRRVTLPRLLRRTLRRLLSLHAETGTPRESWRRLVGRESILLWGLRSHGPLREEYEHSAALYGERGTSVVRLRTPTATAEWMSSIRYECGPPAGVHFDRPG